MRPPNFFILGAPKCGTTALADYLRDHPRIFMPRHKEPHFYNTDHPKIGPFKTREQYLANFEDAGAEHQAVGEASVHYLRSQVAIDNILDAHPDALFIAMFRNPISFLPSWHNQLQFSLSEDEPDFAKAWALQDVRRRGEMIPAGCRHPMQLDYLAAARFGAQARKLLDKVPRQRILFLQFEDFIANTLANYRKTLEYLNVEDDGRTEFARVNAAHQHKSRWGGWALNCGYKWLSSINPLSRDNPIRRIAKRGLLVAKKANTTYRRPDPIPDALADNIRTQLAEDADLLYELTGIDYRQQDAALSA